MKKIIVILSCVPFIFLMSGCFNYRDINKQVYVTAFLVDIDETDNIVLYNESFKPYKSTSQGVETGVRLVSKGIGKTLFEAERDLNLSSSYKNNYTQNKAIIFSERAARKGLDKFIDFIDRDQELLIRPHVFVYLGDINDFFNLNIKEEEYIGMYLYNLIENVGASSRSVEINFNTLMEKMASKSKTTAITAITINQEAMEPKIQINGAAIIDNYKMVDYIDKRRSQRYSFLINEVKTGTMEVTNPYHDDQYVTLEILNANTKTRLYYRNNNILMEKHIKVKTSLAETQRSVYLNPKSAKIMEKSAENNLIFFCSDIFQKFITEKVDAFSIQDEFYRKYPHLPCKNIWYKTQLKIYADVVVEGSSDKTNWYK
ncbi:Ger(x)C family spore germination protein [Clostridium oryzae]|uniref:Spore germination protein A3 n=1 Tax=Clostridium oryzae TaxID=1450648 RepID=A0A1V4IJI8_9CLOT|nr:Ger(x)C family spore germination protein [Clostridium oryzae]OPJ60096.1 spore germination protein A3 precursor [Clostridium oryzae]